MGRVRSRAYPQLSIQFDSYADVQSAMTETGEGTLLALGNGSVLFEGLSIADFVADDFMI